ncbi:5-oxoprolinase subunit B family protein [Carnimonas bestiolae]|uniref:5-oxoprolinase subunit B family protein n=1 Tax=Carnimonas bestiolae TaxID=3402172 RepID=UPI003EDC9DDC
MTQAMPVRIEAAGVDALLISFEAASGASLSARIVACAHRIEASLGDLVLDMVPSWDTLLIHYDAYRADFRQLMARLSPLIEQWQLDAEAGEAPCGASRHHLMPVWYCGEDLAMLANVSGLSVAEVIEAHASAEYFVGAVGFAPGFAYMGGLDERLMLPRRETPRTEVPWGSVAITEGQTCIYPNASPAGWHLLGRCPLKLYDVARTPPGRFRVGDSVGFVPIDEQQFIALSGHWQWLPEHAHAADDGLEGASHE